MATWELIGCPPRFRAIHVLVSELFGGGGFCAQRVWQILCLCSELCCPEGSSCKQFVATPTFWSRVWLLVPFFCVFSFWQKKDYQNRGLAVVCCCGGRSALFSVYSMEANCAHFCLADFLVLVRFFTNLFLTLSKYLVLQCEIMLLEMPILHSTWCCVLNWNNLWHWYNVIFFLSFFSRFLYVRLHFLLSCYLLISLLLAFSLLSVF